MSLHYGVLKVPLTCLRGTHTLTIYTLPIRQSSILPLKAIGVGDGRGQRENREKLFNYHVKFGHFVKFLLLARYVHNVAKRSIWEQCKKKYYIEDRPATSDRRPTNDLTFGKIQMAISRRGVARSTSCLVLWWGFRGRQIEWRHFRCDHIQ